MQTKTQTEETVKHYILQEFLPGEDPQRLTDSTPLISTSILDSMATIKLVAFLESQFQITLEAHEVSNENLETIASICRLVDSKQHGR
jgi:acyl carrier protein